MLAIGPAFDPGPVALPDGEASRVSLRIRFSWLQREGAASQAPGINARSPGHLFLGQVKRVAIPRPYADRPRASDIFR